MLRLGATASAIGIVALLLVAGGAAAEEFDGETTPEMDATAAQDLGTVEVVVVDRSGDGIRNVQVTASWPDGEDTVSTAADGRALLDVPVNTTIEFSVEHPDGEYVRNHQPVVAFGVTGDRVTIEMAEPGDVELEVVDTNGDPVEDVRLDLFHQGDDREVANATTDGDGTATITDIEQRAYNVTTLRSGYNTVETNFTLDRSRKSESLEIESNRVQVSFFVTDNHFDPPEPLEGAVVDIAEFSPLPPTFADGTQDQNLPVNDEYQITVDKEGYDPAETTLELGEEAARVNVSLRRSPEININQLQDAVVVDQQTLVTVTNAYGEPVTGASVSLNGDSVGTTDDKGQIFFNVTSVGENTLDASYDGLSASGTIEGVDPNPEPPEPDDGDDGNNTENGDDTGNEDDEDALGPGFGLGAAIAGVVALTALLARRRRVRET